MQTVTMKEIYDKLGTLTKSELILDVRTPEEYAAGHIPGSRNIPHDQVALHADELRKYSRVYIHCQAGGRVQMACYELGTLGLDNMAAVVSGGMPDWFKAGYPVERA